MHKKTQTHVYTYIYIERERERANEQTTTTTKSASTTKKKVGTNECWKIETKQKHSKSSVRDHHNPIGFSRCINITINRITKRKKVEGKRVKILYEHINIHTYYCT